MRLLLLVALLLTACDSAGDFGDPCGLVGSTNECNNGLVCGRASKGSQTTCIPICAEEKQCPKQLKCHEVEKSKIKACVVD